MLADPQGLTCSAEDEQRREPSNACCELPVHCPRTKKIGGIFLDIRDRWSRIRGFGAYPFASSRSSGLPGYFPSAKRSSAAALSGSLRVRRVLTASA